MSKTISFIELTLDDCSSVRLLKEDIKSFLVLHTGKAGKTCTRNPMQADAAVFLQIAEKPHNVSNDSGDEECPFACSGLSSSQARLLGYDDITFVTVVYDDGTRDCYEVEFFEYELCDNNKWQQTRIAKDGTMYILIGKDLKMEDYVSAGDLMDAKEQHALKHAVRKHWKF